MATKPRLDFAPLRALRLKRGWSQKELSGVAGMHRITLWRIETNRIEPPMSKVFALSRALGVPAERLYIVIE